MFELCLVWPQQRPDLTYFMYLSVLDFTYEQLILATRPREEDCRGHSV